MKSLFLASIFLITTTISADHFYYDKSTSLVWQDFKDNKELSMSYDEAHTYCKNLVIAKYDKFRIPSLKELQTIVDYTKFDPAIKQGFDYVDDASYWTTTAYAEDVDKIVWLINFEKGERNVKHKDYARHIRCVQGKKR